MLSTFSLTLLFSPAELVLDVLRGLSRSRNGTVGGWVGWGLSGSGVVVICCFCILVDCVFRFLEGVVWVK